MTAKCEIKHQVHTTKVLLLSVTPSPAALLELQYGMLFPISHTTITTLIVQSQGPVHTYGII
jgi:hypothetical protein